MTTARVRARLKANRSEPAADAVGSQVDRWVRRAVRALRWAAVIALGVVLWMLGLVALDVPGSLPQWRHYAGWALLVVALHL